MPPHDSSFPSAPWTALVAAVLSSVVWLGAARAEGPPPVAAPGDLVTDYQGILVADPYRGLEDIEAPGNRAWVAAQANATRQALDRLPGLAS